MVGIPNLNPPTATPGPSGTSPKRPATHPAPPDAVRIALTNRYVKALLNGKAYRIQKVSPWVAGRGKIVTAGFYRAVTVTGTWLASGKPPYHATYAGVTGLSIYVEVARRSVAAITPRFHSK